MDEFWNLDCFSDEDLDEGDENSLGNQTAGGASLSTGFAPM